jgi:hypothetical protein
LNLEPFPPVLNGGREANPELARRMKRVAKDFRWTRRGSLWGVAEIAYLLHVLGRDDEALEAARFLGQYQFAGNFALWTAVEYALALAARVQQQRGRADEAAVCVRRIRQAGFVSERLNGLSLRHDAQAVKLYVKAADMKGESAGRVRLAQELCLMIEFGGSKKYPVTELEKMFRENADRLRAMVDSPGAAPAPRRDQRPRPRAQTKEAKPKQTRRRPRKEE